MGSLLEKMLSGKGCGMPAKVKDSCAGEGYKAEKNTAFIPFPQRFIPGSSEGIRALSRFLAPWYFCCRRQLLYRAIIY
jgi:hypothetical protein